MIKDYVQVSKSSGYLLFNALVFSTEDESFKNVVSVGDYQTNQDFYQLTQYDLLYNVYEIMQGIGFNHLNPHLLDEGFRMAYDEKIRYLDFDQDTYYGTYWDIAIDLLESSNVRVKHSFSYAIGVLIAHALNQSNWKKITPLYRNLSKIQTDPSFYKETAFNLMEVAQLLLEGLDLEELDEVELWRGFDSIYAHHSSRNEAKDTLRCLYDFNSLDDCA